MFSQEALNTMAHCDVCILVAVVNFATVKCHHMYNKTPIPNHLCDLAKDFHYVNDEILISKLEYYDVRGSNQNWFKYHLLDRKQTMSQN
jgi:hypothetical protein